MVINFISRALNCPRNFYFEELVQLLCSVCRVPILLEHSFNVIEQNDKQNANDLFEALK